MVSKYVIPKFAPGQIFPSTDEDLSSIQYINIMWLMPFKIHFSIIYTLVFSVKIYTSNDTFSVQIQEKNDWKSNIFHIQIQERKKKIFSFIFIFINRSILFIFVYLLLCFFRPPWP